VWVCAKYERSGNNPTLRAPARARRHCGTPRKTTKYPNQASGRMLYKRTLEYTHATTQSINNHHGIKYSTFKCTYHAEDRECVIRENSHIHRIRAHRRPRMCHTRELTHTQDPSTQKTENVSYTRTYTYAGSETAPRLGAPSPRRPRLHRLYPQCCAHLHALQHVPALPVVACIHQ